MRLTHMRLLPYPRTKPPTTRPPDADHVPAPLPAPAAAAPALPSLVSVVRRTLAPARHAPTVQSRTFHIVYALTTLPLVIALHAALWALSTPGRLGATVLILYGLGRAGILTPHTPH
ncbi:hypothetical protein [Embleya sp. AB8]|uniref:hypothetical protein n=1 Tax=Embleya sp. AB8 TaxID=3156304 RepID=UPI003C76C8DA